MRLIVYSRGITILINLFKCMVSALDVFALHLSSSIGNSHLPSSPVLSLKFWSKERFVQHND